MGVASADRTATRLCQGCGERFEHVTTGRGGRPPDRCPRCATTDPYAAAKAEDARQRAARLRPWRPLSRVDGAGEYAPALLLVAERATKLHGTPTRAILARCAAQLARAETRDGFRRGLIELAAICVVWLARL